MPLRVLLLSFLGALVLSGLVTLALRAMHRTPRLLMLKFETTSSRARDAWLAFWARDPFIAAQKKRTGPAFATYAIPGGNRIAVHTAPSDFRQHTLVLGATGTGKSSLLEGIALHHLREQQPFALVDLHGDLYARVAAWASTLKAEKLVRIDFTQPEALPGWNPFDRIEGVDTGRHVDLLVGVLKRLYAGEDAASWAWGVKVEELTRYALKACIESTARMSLADLPSFFLLSRIRALVLETASSETRAYFLTRYGAREQTYVSAVLNKLEPFLGSHAVQRFLGHAQSTIDLFGAMDRGDTVLINLARGYLGPTAEIMGRLLTNVFQTAALRRERFAPELRKPYALLLDEAHVLAGAESGLEEFLVAARKYRVFVTLAAQGLSLFPASFRPHLLGNTGRQFFFRLPYSEARMLANDIFEPLGTIYRQQTRPNERIEEPLLTASEEMAWRTRDLASLPVGACYWFVKSRSYKARRIDVLPPLKLPYRTRELSKHIDTAMIAQRVETPVGSADELSDEIRAVVPHGNGQRAKVPIL